jgi:sodium/bile acid cotransporter 7
MLPFLLRRWFLLALVSTIALGHWLGSAGPDWARDAVDRLLSNPVKAWLNAAVLFSMSVTLDGSRIHKALLSPAPVVWAILVNTVLIPLTAPVLMPLQQSPDFAIGLLIAASVPSTMAAASVWTRRAGGNDAISLLVTLITNAGCVLFTPYWLMRFGAGTVRLDLTVMVYKLLLTALLPTVLGQVVRRWGAAARSADRHKTALGTAAQIGILLIVFSAACDGGVRLAREAAASPEQHAAPPWQALAVVAVSCIGLHVAALGVALAGAAALRMPREDRIAVGFAASQKTLPIGVLIATDPALFGTDYPWAVIPMIIYHASQLFIDATIADAMARPAAGGSAGPSSRPSAGPDASGVSPVGTLGDDPPHPV